MSDDQHTLPFQRLSPERFEEFAFDLLQALGFVNVDWRKGTGKRGSPSDRGRDIVAQEVRKDLDDAVHLETWLIDCKHFRSGIPPRELQNLLTWAEAEAPHVALFIASGFLSNSAKDYIESYKRTRRPPFKIKTWERPTIVKLARRRLRLLRKFGLSDAPLRPVKAIVEVENELTDKIWYDRHQMRARAVREGRDRFDPEIWRGALRAAKAVEKRLGKRNLGPYSDFEWGMLSGKLSALRWVLGLEWDILDT